MKRGILISTVVVFLLLAVTIPAETFDPTTSKPITTSAGCIEKPLDELNSSQSKSNDNLIYDLSIDSFVSSGPAICDTRDGDILWDLTHGSHLGYDPSDRYSDLADYLEGMDYTVSMTSEGLDNVDLSQYGTIVVCLGSAWYGIYTTNEINAIADFVTNGGGLLIMGDNSDCPNGNINPVAAEFGFIFSDYLSPLEVYINDINDHPIFNGITEIFYMAAGAVTATPPAEEVAHYDGYGVAAVAEFGSGRVVALSDMNGFTDDYIVNSQNQAFAGNVFDWLSNPPETNVIWDLTHGVYLGYEPADRYANLVTLLEGQDFTISTTSTGLDNEDLSQYEIVVIGLGSAWDGAYTTNEINAVADFVNNGGGLLLMGDNDGCPIGNVNPVGTEFGTIFSGTLEPTELYISDLDDHPIFEDITEIYYIAAGEITVFPPAEEVARYDGYSVAAVAEIGSGRVLALSDFNCYSNLYIPYAQNQAFAGNVFSWLGGIQTDIDESELTVPTNFSLSQNYPNPFNAITTIGYELPERSQVNIEIYDILGKRVGVIQDGFKQAGYHHAIWNAENMASGTYFYKLQADDYTETRKMVLLK